MLLTLDEVIEQYPYLNRKWIIGQAKKGLIPCSRPHYRLFMFEDEKFEKALSEMGMKQDDKVEAEVVKDFFNTRYKEKSRRK